MSKVETKAGKLTPALAASLLERNCSNRPMRRTHARRLAEAIERGEWMLNGESVKVSTSGQLLDGQHRCQAVVDSGVTIDTIFVSNLDDVVFKTIDRGVGRTTADSLHIEKEPNSTVLAAALRLLHIYYRTDNPYNGNAEHNPTTSQQFELLAQCPSLRQSASWAASTSWVKKYVNASLGAFCHFVFFQADAKAAKRFFAELESGVGLEAGSPVLALRDRLTDMQASKNNKLSKTYKAALIFKAFRLFRDGASIKFLRVRTEGEAPEKDVFLV
jgi:hypothetical protein